MNKVSILVISAALIASTLAISCPDGYYDPGSGATRCIPCPIQFSSCSSSTNGTVRTVLSTGWEISSTTSLPVAWCPSASVSGTPYTTNYNKTSNYCLIDKCATGCNRCTWSIDFCTNCDQGYVWNNDFTCIPATIGLEAASLAFLVIGLVLLVITCCLVNKARK